MSGFFTSDRCDRCGHSLMGGRHLSAYNDDCICNDCRMREMDRKDYWQTLKRHSEEVQRGNWDFR